MMRSLVPIALVLAAGSLVAQPKYGHRDPYAVLATAAKKSAELRSARFVATLERKAFDADASVTTRALVTALRDSANPVGARYRIDGSDGALALYNGDTMWVGLANDPLDVFAERVDAEGSARSQTLIALVSRLVFGVDDPFTGVSEGAAEIECEGLDTIDGVVCHAMTVTMPDVEGYTGRVRRYSFGADDYVLRRLISETQWEGMTERITFTISKVTIDSSLAPSTFSYDADRERRPLNRARPVPSEGSTVPMVRTGDIAPAWALRDPKGAEIALAALRGKVVVIDFWGTWCRPCVMALPEIQKIHEEYRDRDVVVVGIDVEQSSGADPVGMMKRKGATYTLALGGGEVARSYGITSYPSMVVIGRDGRVLHTGRGFGPTTAQEVRAVLDAAVASR